MNAYSNVVGKQKQVIDKPKQGRSLRDLYSRPGFLLRRANQIAMNIATQECAKIGLTPPQHVCLIALHRYPGIDQISLGKALGIDRATIGQILRSLEARGFVSRSGFPDDGRRKRVSLTMDGKRLACVAKFATIRASKRILSALDLAQRRTFVALLQKTVTALNSESPSPVEPPDTAAQKRRQ